MSAAPVSRSSALPEITLPNRRSSERGELEQAFTLPQEPEERPRPRVEDGRSTSRGSPDTRDESKSGDDVRRTAAADAKSPARTDEAGKDRKAAGANEPSDKAKAGPATDEAATKDAMAVEDKTAEPVSGDKPAKGKTAEESKAVPAAALDGAPVVSDAKPEAQAVPVAPPQPVPVPGVAAEFLALAALTVQVGEPAKPDEVVAQESKPEGQVTAAGAATNIAAQTVVNSLVVPAPTAPVKADGQANAPDEVAAAGIKAGSTPPPVVASGQAKVGVTAGEAQLGDAKAVDGQSISKDAGEAGKAMPTATGNEIKATEATAASQPAQVSATDDAASATAAQPASAPSVPQAILAAVPQSLITPQAPLTELDAAAQATAHAQAEAAHRTITGDTGRATPLHVVPVEIGAQALAGNKRFDIRLDPAELGRIDVRLEISDKGEVSAKLTVDRVETLHMLQRDARTLERAFEQAGLKPSEGGIDMSLRDQSDQSGARQQQRHENESQQGRRAWVQVSDDSALVAEVASLPRNAGRLGGVDLSI